ncbi:MAG TPA: pilin [Dyella sp.]|uniref:pilin n=1 Tax=Dyella sp. TaxID=1869338 RepID=UPI002F94E9BF
MRIHRGISVVTVLVAVAILAVIAAFAIPAWRGHVVNQHLGEALKGADAAKLVVMEAVTMRGGLAKLHPNDLIYNTKVGDNPYLASVKVSDSGRITVVTQNTGAEPEPTFLLTPLETIASGQALSWSCDIVAGDARQKPATCVRPEKLPADTRASVAAPASSPAPAASR